MKLLVVTVVLILGSISGSISNAADTSLSDASHSAQEDMATSQMDWEESQTARAKDFAESLKEANYFEKSGTSTQAIVNE